MKNKKLLFFFLGLLSPMISWAQLSGNYTINPAGFPAPPNFTSFNAAVSALTTQGVSGPVVFTVSPDTYTETVVITSIPGAGPNATVTFQSNSGPENCIITFNTAAGGIAIGTVNLRGASHVSFKGITMRNIQSANSAALHIFAGDSNPGTYDVRAAYLNFDNCRFVVDTTNTAANRFGVFISNNSSWAGYSGRTTLAHKVSFTKCLFKGGSDGIGVLPSGTANWYSFPVDSISIDSCEAVKQRSYGFEFWGCKNVSLTNSRIHEMRTGDGNASAVRFFHSLEYNLRGNYVICGHRIGLWTDIGGNAAAFGPSYVVNNYIVSNGATNQAAYLSGSKNVRYYHNTFLSSGAGGVGVDFNGAITGNEFVNNIVVAGTNANVNVFNAPSTAGGFTAVDHNVYYGANGGSSRFYWGTNYTGLAAWQAAVPAFNVNSVFGATTLAAGSPEITDPATVRTGTSLGVTHDIFGTPRSATTPVVGAYEYVVPVVPLAGVYTINPAGSGSRNYTSFTAATDAMSYHGIGGDVSFEVSDDIYEEQVVVDDNINVVGTAPYNVVFRSISGDPGACVLRKPASGTPPGNLGIGVGTLNLRGAGFDNQLRFSFEGIGVENFLSAANQAAVHIYAGDGSGAYTSATRNVRFNNCRFTVDTTLTTARFGVFIANNSSWAGYTRPILAHALSFKKCLFKGGTVGLGLLTSGTSNWYGSPVDSLSIDSSEAVLQYSYGFELWGAKNVSVTNTHIHRMRTGNSAASALRLFQSLEFNVRNNHIICGHRIGLEVNHAGSPSLGTSYVVNNYISGNAGACGYLSASKNVKYYHNTFKSTLANGVGVDFNGAITGNEFVNNIVEAGTSANVNVFNSPSTAGGFTAIDYNVYYGANGGSARFYWGTNYTGLAAWQTAVPAFNVNSVFGATTLAAGSPEITDVATVRTGTGLGITHDIFGATRSNTDPTIGAYEFPLPSPPVQPGVFIVKTDTVCNPPQSGVRYTINAVPGATAYEWEGNGGWWNIAGAGAGVTFNGGANDTSVLIEFMSGAGTGFLTVRAKNAGGTSAGRTTQIVILTTPQQPSAFTASSATVCRSQNNVAYTVPNVSGVTYNWSYTGSGATINGTGNSVTVNFNGSATSGTLSVTATNKCGTGTARALAVTVNTVPAQPGAFTASSTSVCRGQNGVVYTVPNVANTTYAWSYSGTGATINGTGNSVTVNFSAAATNGDITVTPSNTCGSGTARTVSVVVNDVPDQPVSFTDSSAEVCVGQTGVLYSVPNVAGVSYAWSYTGMGATINGTGSSVSVDFGTTAAGGTLTVTPSNTCGSGSGRDMDVYVFSLPQVSIVPGDTSICTGETITLRASTQDTGLVYRWKDGSTAIPQADADTLDVSNAGVYTVVVARAHISICTDSSVPVSLTLLPLPVVAATWDGLLLHATPGYDSYQWYNDGQGIPGATNETYQPSADGSFTVSVIDSNGCTALSPAIQVNDVFVSSFIVSARNVQVYPNPAGNIVYINAPVDVDVTITGMDGKLLQHIPNAGKLDIGYLPDGIYLLRITHNGMLLKHEKLTKAAR